MLVSRLVILHLLLAALVAAPAVCCGQVAAAGGEPEQAAPTLAPDDCPGHGRAAAAVGSPRVVDAADCSGCALPAAIPSPSDQGVVFDDFADVPCVAAAGASAEARPRCPSSDRWAVRSAAPPGGTDTPVTRFDQLLIPG
jgi:hypothetical protein